MSSRISMFSVRHTCCPWSTSSSSWSILQQATSGSLGRQREKAVGAREGWSHGCVCRGHARHMPDAHHDGKRPGPRSALLNRRLSWRDGRPDAITAWILVAPTNCQVCHVILTGISIPHLYSFSHHKIPNSLPWAGARLGSYKLARARLTGGSLTAPGYVLCTSRVYAQAHDARPMDRRPC